MMSCEENSLRRIFKSSMTGTAVIRELMQFIFLAEMLNPSKEVWLVSPWVSDVPILDNSTGNFDIINPDWHRRNVSLSDLIVQLLTGNSTVRIVTRPDTHNKTFLNLLHEKVKELSLDEKLHSIQRETLHTKGILTGTGLLLGSMNFTYRGFELNDEVIEYDIDVSRMSIAQKSFEEYLVGKNNE